MKEKTSHQEKSKNSAQEWVAKAKNLGEQCVTIQKDSKLSTQQKSEKLHTLSTEIIKEIQNASTLNQNDKKRMIDSINDYMKEWQKISDLQGVSQEKKGKPTQKK